MEKNHYICIPATDIDSILKIDKKAYPQAYLEEYKYTECKLVSFIDDEIIDDEIIDDEIIDDEIIDDDGYDSDNENDS